MTPAATPSSATRDKKLAAIRAVCIKANPAIQIGEPLKLLWNTGEVRTPFSPIRLADVLLAIRKFVPGDFVEFGLAGEKIHRWRYACYQLAGAGRTPDECLWNLRADSLDEQDDTCINFLHSLLS